MAILAPNSGFEAVLALYSNFFIKITLIISPYDDWPCCGPPLLPLQGTWVTEYAHNDNFSRPNLPKLASNEPNFSQNHDLCAIFFFPNSSNPNRKIFNGPSLRKHLYCSIGTLKIIILAHLRPTFASWV